MENPIKIDDLGVPLFLETPIYVCVCGAKKLLPLPYQKHPSISLTTSPRRFPAPTRDVRRKSPQMSAHQKSI